MEGRHVGIHQKSDLGVLELEPGEQEHAVAVVLWLLEPERELVVKDRQFALPEVVGLERQQDVRPGRGDEVQQRPAATVVGQDIGDQQPELALRIGIGAGQHLHGCDRREGVDAVGLVGDRDREGAENQLLERSGRPPEHRHEQRQGAGRRDLQEREVPDPHPPVPFADEGQNGRGDDRQTGEIEGDLHGLAAHRSGSKGADEIGHREAKVL